MKKLIKIKELNKSDILEYCKNRYLKNNYTQNTYKNKAFLFSLFDKALKNVSNYCLNNITGDIKNGNDLISCYSSGSKHDSYLNISEVLDWFAGHEVFCEMARLYNCNYKD